jgi:predicted amidophosphoribosyltransferase
MVPQATSPSKTTLPRHCGQCLKTPPPWRHAHAAVDYGYPWAGLLARLKYGGEPAWARHLAALWPDPHQPAHQGHDPDWVIPVPSTPERWLQRGYNPAQELARHWVQRASNMGLRVQLSADALRRPYRARAQASLPRHQRLRNPVGAFEPSAAMRSVLAQASVLLVDDVMTTGATLRAAAQALQQMGCTNLTVWVVARVLPPPDDHAHADDHAESQEN